MSQVADQNSDFKIYIMSTRGPKSTDFGAPINIAKLSQRAFQMLAKIDPRLKTKEFYELPLSQRKITVYQHSLLDAFDHGASKATEPYAGAIVPSQVDKHDPALQVGSYGSPHFSETFVNWLNGAATALSSAVTRSRDARAMTIRSLDQDLDVWLRAVAHRGTRDINSVVSFDVDNGKWSLKWDELPLTKNEVMNEALQMRLRDRAIEAGALDLREYMLSRPDTARMASLADNYLFNQPREYEASFASW